MLGFTQVGSNGFNHPTCLANASDGSQRLFIVQQPGIISILQSGAALTQPFHNITDRVSTAGQEQGLLGLAFPQEFPFTGEFYVDYTSASNNTVVVSGFLVSQTNANVADPGSEQVILTIPKPYSNHNGGQLAFGPGGYLYIRVGDGGAEGDPLNFGQNTNALLGKILRIDVHSRTLPYGIPPDNPFVNTPGSAPEIWAYGLRNPWRFSFDRATSDLYIADVGQDAYEEINFQPANSAGGQNYGWRMMEGPSPYAVPAGFTNFAALTPPVAWYSHASIAPVSGGGAAVVGGYVYYGPSQPRMEGMYFYGDFLAGWIWGLMRDGTNWQSVPLYSPSTPSYLISSFGQDEAGELYFADYARGRIYQVYDTQQVWPPVFSPAGGVINSNTVSLSCVSPNAEIHMTTNGLDPTLSDPEVASGATPPTTTE